MNERFRAIHTVIVEDDCIAGKAEQYSKEVYRRRNYFLGVKYYDRSFNLNIDESTNNSIGFNSNK